MASKKGNIVKLKIFKNWQKPDVVGYKTEIKDGITYVNFVWCNVCAQNETAIKADKACKGEAGEAMLQYVKGTNFVTKHTVNRHFASRARKIAIDNENAKENEGLKLPS